MAIKTIPVDKIENDEMNKAVFKICDLLQEFKDPNKINTMIMGIICNFNLRALKNACDTGVITNKKQGLDVFSEYMTEFKKLTEHLFNQVLEINRIFKE